MLKEIIVTVSKKASEFIQDNAEFEPCACGSEECSGRRPIAVMYDRVTNQIGDHKPLARFKMKDGTTSEEYIQDVVERDGVRFFFMAIRTEGGVIYGRTKLMMDGVIDDYFANPPEEEEVDPMEELIGRIFGKMKQEPSSELSLLESILGKNFRIVEVPISVLNDPEKMKEFIKSTNAKVKN